MSAAKKGRRRPSLYNRQLNNFIDLYVEETGNHDWEHMEVSRWIIGKGDWTPPRYDPVKHLARDLSRAARQEYIENENGEPVRRKHPYRYPVGDRFQTSWFNIENTTPEKVKLSLQQRRNGIRADVFQAERDLRYYNKNYNRGEQIMMSWNFDPDRDEADFSGEYDDTPPDSDEDES